MLASASAGSRSEYQENFSVSPFPSTAPISFPSSGGK